MRIKLLFALVLSLPTLVSVHSGATGVVKQRLDVMKKIGTATKRLGLKAAGKNCQKPFRTEH
ncbi:MAG: hypothetical protein AAF217_04730 [Pseudomonadota bacterium]